MRAIRIRIGYWERERSRRPNSKTGKRPERKKNSLAGRNARQQKNASGDGWCIDRGRQTDSDRVELLFFSFEGWRTKQQGISEKAHVLFGWWAFCGLDSSPKSSQEEEGSKKGRDRFRSSVTSQLEEDTRRNQNGVLGILDESSEPEQHGNSRNIATANARTEAQVRAGSWAGKETHRSDPSFFFFGQKTVLLTRPLYW